MKQLLSFDKGNPKLPRHFKPSLIEDEFETPKELFMSLVQQYQIFPKIDVAATEQNRKCLKYFSKEDNALEQEFTEDIWGNHPHTLHAEFAQKYCQQWQKHNINCLTIFPANCGRMSYWHEFVEGKAEYHFIKGPIMFLHNGKPFYYRNKKGKMVKGSSRNAYLVVIWRKRLV